MLEVLGLTALEEIGLLGVIGADIVMPELLIAEAAILAGVFIVRAIRKHKREKEEEENKPSQNDDQEEPEAPENLDDDIIEENKEIDKEIDKENPDLVQEEEVKESQELIEREARLNVLRKEEGVEEETADEFLLYPPGVREEIQELERRQAELDEQRRHQNNGGDGGGGNGGGGNGGGGGDGGGDDGGNDQNFNPNNDNDRRGVNPNENPFTEFLKQQATNIATSYAQQLIKEKEQEKEHEEKKITDAEYEQLQAENQQIKNQLETQKQLLDILDAIGVNELTDEESLVQLEKIDKDIKEMIQKQVKVGDVFSQDLVTF